MLKTRGIEPAWIPLGYEENTTLSEKWNPDDKLFKFSTGSRYFTLDRAFRGIKIYGATGSGKSTGFAKVIATSFLDHGFGGLVLCAKGSNDELHNWQSMAEAVQRRRSLIHFGPKNTEQSFCFNVLEFIRTLTNNKDESQANVVKILKLIANDLQGSQLSQSDSFWDGVTDQYLTHLLTLTYAVDPKAPLTFDGLNMIFKMVQTNASEILGAIHTEISLDVKNAIHFFTEEFPALNEKTRSVIVAAVSSLLFKFSTGMLRDLFGGEGNIDPRWVFSGAVIVINVPTLEFQEIGRLANMIWKYAFQKACMARKVSDRMRPVFLWADEAQEFVTAEDAKFQAVARSSKCATVYLTQNIAGLRLNLGKHQANDAFRALEANLMTAIFHQNVDLETNDYASKVLGTKKVKTKTIQSKGPFSADYGESTSEKEVPNVKIDEFVKLKSGGPANRKIVEAIVYSPGGKFSFDWINWHFRDWLKIRIKQGKYEHLRKPSIGKLEPDFTSLQQ